MTTPDQVRTGLQIVTNAAASDTRAVAAAGGTPADIRASLFAAVPLIVGDYIDGSAALALDWYEELRDAADPAEPFRPTLFTQVDAGEVSATIASATRSLYDLEQDLTQLTDEILRKATEDALVILGDDIQQTVMSGFTETMVGNSEADPAAAGWKRFARPEACKFCLMLAARGAVYTRETARFAAHGAVTNGKRTGGNCMCIAGPEFGGKEVWAEATPMQYMASQKRRTAKDREALRAYLNKNYPDSPG